MENRITQLANSLKGDKFKNRTSLTFVRYADDFVCLHPDREVIEQAKSVLTDWLNEVGLELSESKTCISHTSDGFNFLGFNIRQYPVGKYNSGKSSNGEPLGYKTLIKPSQEKVKKHYDKMADIISRHNSSPQKVLISKLNPVIRGWANYYSSGVSKKTYSKLDHLIWQRLKRWCERRHPNKSATWAYQKYFKSIADRNWVFGDQNSTLTTYSETPIIRHIKVKGEKSPYDGELGYWAGRLGRHPELPARTSKLLKNQKNKCNHCGLTFRDGDVWEVDHIIPKSIGGKNWIDNLQLLHRHCHDTKTVLDGSLNLRCTHNKS